MYLAFRQGMIEGGPETIGIAVDQKNVELAKFWTRTDEYFQIVNVMINGRRFQSLTEEQRSILRQAAKEGGLAYRAESERGFTEKRQRAEREFNVAIMEPDLGPWRETAPGDRAGAGGGRHDPARPRGPRHGDAGPVTSIGPSAADESAALGRLRPA